MIAFRLSAKQWVAAAYQAGETELPDDCLERIYHLFDAILWLGFEENPLPNAQAPPGKRGRP
jgi:hypothetical protein